jgi:hypothetical protein
VVGTETIANPGYITWLEMPEKERKKIEKPSDIIEVEKKENVEINITKVKKVGVFSVSYRLVDASSGKIIYPDSLTLEDSHTDTSSEGVEMGEFVLPFKWAELPSDIKILDGLAVEAGISIGEKLVAQLENQDGKYLESADKHYSEHNCKAEVDSLGKSLVISQLKTQDTDYITDRLINRSLQCKI